VSSLSERTSNLASRMTSSERPRQLQEVSLILVDGTEIRGMLHRAHGSRTLDFLNRQAEGFVAMTDVELTRGEDTEYVSFIAVNKAHIIRVVEAADVD
jgi:hypothetical protein